MLAPTHMQELYQLKTFLSRVQWLHTNLIEHQYMFNYHAEYYQDS